jgi:hypothetical protein
MLARAAGVCWIDRHKTWRAAIHVDCGTVKDLGCFSNKVDAALAYDQVIHELDGDKARLNFPDLPPQPRVLDPPPQPRAADLLPQLQATSRKTRRQITFQYRGKSRCTRDAEAWTTRSGPHTDR